MADVNPGLAWGTHALSQSTWEDVLNDLLRDPDGKEAVEEGAEEQRGDDGFLELVDRGWKDAIRLGEGADCGAWWSAPPVDVFVGDGDLAHIDETFIVDGDVSLPGLSSEVSSLGEGGDLSLLDVPQGGVLQTLGERETETEREMESRDAGVSSPGSCSRVDPDSAPSSNSGDEAGNEAGNGSSRSHSPVLTSCSDEGTGSPDAGCDSSDVGAMGRSCDNFVEQSERFGDKASGETGEIGEVDDDSKRQSRLMRNRESATQSRLRKKAYIKELEAKCRAMESQMSMLHQTVACTSAQNAALREELAHYRCQKGNGLKSGAMEPAALPSDSLPSESPSRRTTPCLSVKELVAFLCHVLLLTLVQHLKSATSGGRAPSEAWSERREPLATAGRIERLIKVAKQLQKSRCSSNRGRGRFVLCRDDNSLRSRKSVLFSATLKPELTFEGTITNCKTYRKMSLNRLSRRSQYGICT